MISNHASEAKRHELLAIDTTVQAIKSCQVVVDDEEMFRLLSDTLKKTESQRWTDVSPDCQYFGRYQFCLPTLKRFGFQYDIKIFLLDTNLQNMYLRMLIAAARYEGFTTFEELIDYHKGGTLYARARKQNRQRKHN